jgi:antirestriction protein
MINISNIEVRSDPTTKQLYQSDPIRNVYFCSEIRTNPIGSELHISNRKSKIPVISIYIWSKNFSHSAYMRKVKPRWRALTSNSSESRKQFLYLFPSSIKFSVHKIIILVFKSNLATLMNAAL